MAITAEDLELLGSFIDKKITAAVAAPAAAVPVVAEVPRESIVGVPDVPFDAGPLFYIHLANGEVVQSHDSASTHLADSEGRTQMVIGRYPVGG